jgi:RNA polymerase sigma factor (sigma-70 family)
MSVARPVLRATSADGGSPTPTQLFERERPRLVALARRVLDDRHEGEDVVQTAWIRLHGTTTTIDDPPAWLTTVTTRICLDRLRARVPTPVAVSGTEGDGPHHDAATVTSTASLDPEGAAVQKEAVGQALHVVVDRLTPTERVAWVLHESFAIDFETIASILDRSPAAARKLASRARAKVSDVSESGPVADERVVDAFMAAARGSDLTALLALLAPDADVSADAAAVTLGTPERIEGREAVAGFFDGSARAALPAMVAGRPGAAWFHRGRPLVAFDFTVVRGLVAAVVFRAAPEALATIVRRVDAAAGAGVPDTPGTAPS